MSAAVDVAIVGAGPYGLAVAAHLLADGREVRIFGEPLHFWQTQTPTAMMLRSPAVASDIGHRPMLALRDHARESGQLVPTPIPVEQFVEYGQWFQKRAVPDLDIRDVRGIEPVDSGFRVTVDDDVYVARRVVVAAGIGRFAHRPSQFAALGRDVASHTLDHHDLGIFRGRRVTVVGGGQSALESAALLHETGADVDVLVRSQHMRWLSSGSRKFRAPLIKKLLYAPPGIGPAFISHLNAKPGAFRRFPGGLRERMDRDSTKPAGASWLRRRLDDVSIRTGVEIADATVARRGTRLRLSDGTEQRVDHVLLGTGYRVDLSRYEFLTPPLVQAIDCVKGYPQLSKRFETTVPGLYVVGAPAAWSFGPLMRFVAGSGFTGRALARTLPR